MTIFAKNLRKIREEKNISRAELAEKLHATVTSISYYETSKTQPDLDKLVIIADTLNVSIDELLGHKTNPLQWAHDFAESCSLLSFRENELDLLDMVTKLDKATQKAIKEQLNAHKGKYLLFVFHNGTAESMELLTVFYAERDFVAAMQELDARLHDCMKAISAPLAREILLAYLHDHPQKEK